MVTTGFTVPLICHSLPLRIQTELSTEPGFGRSDAQLTESSTLPLKAALEA
jgi:hypothetical protein